MGSREKWLLVACLALLAVLDDEVEAQLWPQVPLWDIYIRDNHHQVSNQFLGG